MSFAFLFMTVIVFKCFGNLTLILILEYKMKKYLLYFLLF